MAHCAICDLNLNSVDQLVQHNTGKTHLRNQAIKNGQIPGATAKKSTKTTIGNPRQQILFVKAGLLPDNKEVKNNEASPQPLGFDIDPVRDTPEPRQSVSGNKRKAEVGYCSMCDKYFNSEQQTAQHFASEKHLKRVKRGCGQTDDALPQQNSSTGLLPNSVPLRTVVQTNTVSTSSYPNCPPPPPPPILPQLSTQQMPSIPTPTTSAAVGSSNQYKASHGFMFCTFCNLSLNSQLQIQAHRSGAKHRKNVAAAQRQQQQSTITSTTNTTPKLQNY